VEPSLDGLAKKSPAKNAPPDPDKHGVIDVLVVLKYTQSEVKEGAAIHHLIAAGYTKPSDAAAFHKKRYQDADIDGHEKFKKRFDEIFQKKEKSYMLDDTLLPDNFDFG
jgi:hypothetical protein